MHPFHKLWLRSNRRTKNRSSLRLKNREIVHSSKQRNSHKRMSLPEMPYHSTRIWSVDIAKRLLQIPCKNWNELMNRLYFEGENNLHGNLALMYKKQANELKKTSWNEGKIHQSSELFTNVNSQKLIVSSVQTFSH